MSPNTVKKARPVGRPAYSSMNGVRNRREELLETALELFSEKGFQATSIREIASQMGVSVSNLYHYFNNKEGLWMALLEYSIKELPNRLEEAVSAGDSPLDSFKRLVYEHLHQSTLHQRESRMFLIENEDLSEEGRRKNRNIQMKILNIYVQQLERLKDEGLVSLKSTKIMAFNILGVINWHLRWYRADGDMPVDEVHKEILNFILYGVVSN